MKLIECYIESFGKLEGFKYNFSDGLNTVKADNGYGKTTLTVFIKAMLYGLDDTKKAKLEENDRSNITRLMKVKDMMLEKAHGYN